MEFVKAGNSNESLDISITPGISHKYFQPVRDDRQGGLVTFIMDGALGFSKTARGKVARWW